MKNLANILTVTRIMLALVLLIFFGEISVPFLVIYVIAELTDMVDGTIARRTGTCSRKGAMLDTTADVLLVASVVKVVFTMHLLTKKLTLWLAGALGIGVASAIVSAIKHHELFFIHAVSTKLLGGLLSATPFAISFGFMENYSVFLLTVLTLSMLEILIISIVQAEPDADTPSLYHAIKRRKLRTALVADGVKAAKNDISEIGEDNV